MFFQSPFCDPVSTGSTFKGPQLRDLKKIIGLTIFILNTIIKNSRKKETYSIIGKLTVNNVSK